LSVQDLFLSFLTQWQENSCKVLFYLIDWWIPNNPRGLSILGFNCILDSDPGYSPYVMLKLTFKFLSKKKLFALWQQSCLN